MKLVIVEATYISLMIGDSKKLSRTKVIILVVLVSSASFATSTIRLIMLIQSRFSCLLLQLPNDVKYHYEKYYKGIIQIYAYL
jgi:hypothetical protein